MAIAFTIFRGDTAAKGLDFVQEADTSTAYDLTGLTLTITGNTEQNPTDTTNQLFSTTMTITDATAGEAEFALTASEADITPGTYWFDVQAADGSSLLTTIHKGRFKVTQDISK